MRPSLARLATVSPPLSIGNTPVRRIITLHMELPCSANYYSPLGTRLLRELVLHSLSNIDQGSGEQGNQETQQTKTRRNASSREELEACGKPPTRSPPEGLVELPIQEENLNILIESLENLMSYFQDFTGI